MSIADLTTAQLRQAVRAQQELAELDDISDFPLRAATLVRELLQSDHAGYNAVNLTAGRAVVITDPPEAVFEGGPDLLAQLWHQNRLIAHTVTTREQRPLRLSDFMSRRELHRTDIYDQVYRHVPLEFQIALMLPPTPAGTLPGELVGLSAGRARHDFTAADQRLLDVLRPSFVAALTRLRELAITRSVMATGAGADALVLVDDQGGVAWADRGAAELGITIGDQLPAQLRGQHLAGGTPLHVGGQRLHAAVTRDAYEGLTAIHLTRALNADHVRAAAAEGLTARQAEVMALAMTGRTTTQIAIDLGLTPRGVEKHFERIYQRLGVHNRAQAIVHCMRAEQAG